ncbi:hypothetical protein PCO31010_01008 [Pandoraea commovens]|uniref:Uncharacterized protein n=1 Tax=Pandoraea commovens TaxID=2508289 RepID=A0A5E4SRP0_9BURK|nr:hypothetical protein PCO31010_01008 [Pandoraea commovens]
MRPPGTPRPHWRMPFKLRNARRGLNSQERTDVLEAQIVIQTLSHIENFVCKVAHLLEIRVREFWRNGFGVFLICCDHAEREEAFGQAVQPVWKSHPSTPA